MMMRLASRGLLAAGVACAAGGCDALVDGGFAGEPLASMEGTVVGLAHPDDTPELAALRVLWQDARGAEGPGREQSRVQVETRFPAGFVMRFILPPPDGALWRFAPAEPRLAEGYLYVLSGGGDGAIRPELVWGVDYDHAIVYAERDVAAGTMAADYLGGPLAAGFHLVKWQAATDLSAAQEALIAQCAATNVPDAAARCRAMRSYRLSPLTDGDDPRVRIHALATQAR